MVVKANGPIAAEIDRVAAQSADPLTRAGAALKLVQDQIRYVFVGLNGGNYRSIPAEDSWRNRFGDCKAKSVLLMAMLRGLGIPAELVAVNSTGGDGLDERLPGPHIFDHVLVRATIAGQQYYLDGTKSGDNMLSLLEQPKYRHILPLTKDGSDLEQVRPEPSGRPNLIRTIDMDASAGFAEDAKITQQNLILGDEGALYRGQLAALSPDQSDRALRAYWQNQEGWITADEVSWRYDDARSAAILTIKGKAKPDWDGSAIAGRSLSTPRGGFYPPSELKRPDGQDAAVPWQTDFPSYICSVTNVRLPKVSAAKFAWTYDAPPINTMIGGQHYVRRAALADNVFRTIRISKTYLPELTAAEAATIKGAIPGFNNNKAQIYEKPPLAGDLGQARRSVAVPLLDAIDWTAPTSPCTIKEPTDKPATKP